MDRLFLINKTVKITSHVKEMVESIPDDDDILCGHLARVMINLALFANDVSEMAVIEKEQGSVDL